MTIDCQASGIPPPIHQWKRRMGHKAASLDANSAPANELAAIVSGPHMHVLENGSLAIVDASELDRGEYACEA